MLDTAADPSNPSRVAARDALVKRAADRDVPRFRSSSDRRMLLAFEHAHLKLALLAEVASVDR
jgi:hypothetical protein